MSVARFRQWATFIIIGSIFFVINGTFSIRGAATVLPPLGGEALMFWNIITAVNLTIRDYPVPVIAWLFVLICSINEASFIKTFLYERRLPGVIDIILAAFLGGYDFWTTQVGFAATWFAGLMENPRTIVSLVFASVFTFGTEVLYCQLRRRANGRNRTVSQLPPVDGRPHRVTSRPMAGVAPARPASPRGDDGDLF